MPKSASRSYLNLEISARTAKASASPSDEDQLRILVSGDFGGHSGLARQSGQNADSVRVDFDNFDSAVAHFEPSIDFGAGKDDALTLRFRCLEDFHPDKLLFNFDPLLQLVELRERLLDPATSSAACSEVKKLLQLSSASSEAPTTIPDQPPGQILDQLLGKPLSDRAYRGSAESRADHLIKQILGTPSDTVPGEDLKTIRTALEREISKRLRETLHHTSFQALEATWRGLDFLVRNLPDNAILRVADLSKPALSAFLVDGVSDDTPITSLVTAFRPALILGIYSFGPEDHRLLGAIARVCETGQTWFVAGAMPELAGWKSFHSQTGRIGGASLPEIDEIAALRTSREANHLGLILPRFLLRQAYGIRSDPIETFAFEEFDSAPEHESHLWGNSAFLCGHLMSQNFAESGWDFDAGQGGEISGLPVQRIVSGNEVDAKPCAEVWLSETAGEAIRSRGIMPVLSIRGRDAVRITSLHSISDPPQDLVLHRQ
jgi:predicted component of type VI protein secretion system